MRAVDHLTWGNGVDGLSEINQEMPKWFNLMQYTGLKDKNGIEIYEGDIVYVAGYGSMEVKWDVCGYWGFMPDCLDYQDVIEDLERVIGNIYENPELLESTDEPR